LGKKIPKFSQFLVEKKIKKLSSGEKNTAFNEELIILWKIFNKFRPQKKNL